MQNKIVDQLKIILNNSELLMTGLEKDRDESIRQASSEDEQEQILLEFQKSLSGVYRTRNNASALLLRMGCKCEEKEDTLILYVDENEYKLPVRSIKNILGDDYLATIERVKMREEKKPEVINDEMPMINPLDDAFGFDDDSLNMSFSFDDMDFKKEPVTESEPETEQEQMLIQQEPEPIYHSEPEKMKEPELEFTDTDTEPDYPKKSPDEKEINLDDEVSLDLSIFDDELDTDASAFFDDSFDLGNDPTEDVNDPVEPEPIDENSNRDYEMGFEFEPSDTSASESASESVFVLGDEKTDDKTSPDTDAAANEREYFIGGLAESHNPGMLDRNEHTIRDSMEFDIKRPDADTSPDAENNNSSDMLSILNRLKSRRSDYDKSQMEERIKKESERASVKEEESFFDLSTGEIKNGNIDIKEATEKISRVVDGVIHTSMSDKLKDMRIEQSSNANVNAKAGYKMQTVSDYERSICDMLFDIYKLKLNIVKSDGSVKEETVILRIIPTTVPETGSRLATDISACLMTSKGYLADATQINGKTTLTLKCDDYAIIIKGSWENGNFLSFIDVKGRGAEVSFVSEKKEIRPEVMSRAGIGHNVIYLDHATTVHVVPLGFSNRLFDHVELMAVIHKDYGIDTDVECLVTRNKPEIIIHGEKYDYSLSGKWNSNKSLQIDCKINR